MFKKEIYIKRRADLKQRVGSGIIVLFGNNDSPCNYPANTYRYRQDSNFLYYFGQMREGLVGVIDIDNDKEWLIGDDIDIDDIIWYGFVPSVSDLAHEVGVEHSASMKELTTMIRNAKEQGREVHFLPQYRHDLMIKLAEILQPVLDFKFQDVSGGFRKQASLKLIKAIVDMRAVKQPEEIDRLKEAAEIGYQMHTTAMKACKPGVTEKYIAGLIEGIANSHGDRYSFQSIVTMNGQVFHGYPSYDPLQEGRLLLVDAGAETSDNYCSDNTRTTPISGKFTQKQRDIYDAVVDAHDWVLENTKPGEKWLDMHLGACKVITERLKEIGLMKGNTDDAVTAGAHAMFLPHGLGHMMGMDVHDMEGLGQEYVGFDEEVRTSEQFGLNCLRCGRRLQPGFVMTDEPGIYFIPQLIDLWKGQGLHKDFINYDLLETYKDFGGVRIEDDILITKDGNEIIGDKVIPYKSKEVEEFIACR